MLVINQQILYTINVTKSPQNYLTTPICNSFYVYPITALEIEEQLSSLKHRKAAGPFSIPIKIIKILKSIISKPLEMLINFSICSGILPNNSKLAKVIPVFKNGSQNILNHYRPISLVSISNKILEKLNVQSIIGLS